jgi:methionyl-tRNA formyltransferase
MNRDDSRTVVVIGNRIGAARAISDFPTLRLARVWGLAESPLERDWNSRECAARFARFTLADKASVVEQIACEDFDVLVSHGCPFVLPVASLRRPHQLFINLHPSALPRLRGRHPANGALLRRERCAGATLHEMADRVDTGRIIHRQEFDVTADIDLGLLYSLLFDLEVDVFRNGMRSMIAAGFVLGGEEQAAPATYYTRQPQDMQVDFRDMPDDEIVTRVRAFGIESQGVGAEVSGERLRIVEAEPIVNPFVLSKYAGYRPGTQLLKYEHRRLVKSRDGVIKIRCAEEA